MEDEASVQIKYNDEMTLSLTFPNKELLEQFVQYLEIYDLTSFDTYMNISEWAEKRGIKTNIEIHEHWFSRSYWMLRLYMILYRWWPEQVRQAIKPMTYKDTSTDPHVFDEVTTALRK